MKRLSLNVPISKLDEEQRMVYGYASTPELDSQGDRITIDAMKNALPGYMQFANIREMHQPIAVGKTKQATVDEGGLYIGAKIVDDAAWTKVKEGVYSAFSIGGFINKKTGDSITDLDLVEISLVDRPANPGAVIDIWKSAQPSINQFWWATRLPTGKLISLANLSSTMKKNEEVTEEVVETPVEAPAEAPAETPTDVPAEEVKEEAPEAAPETPVEEPAPAPEAPVAPPAEEAAEPTSEKSDLPAMIKAAVAEAIAPLLAARTEEQPVEKVEVKAKASYATIVKGEEPAPTPAQAELTKLMTRHAELAELRKTLPVSEYTRRYSAEAQQLVADITKLKATL